MEIIPHSRLRIYGLALATGMGATAWVVGTRGAGPWVILPLAVGIPALALALFAPALLTRPYRFGLAWGKAFGNVLAWVLMTPLYFLLFTPLALILRLLGKDQLAKNSRQPQWQIVPERDNDPKQLYKLW